MKPYVMLHMPADAFASMTDEQIKAPRENVLADGLWENVEGPVLINGTDYLGVHLPDIFLGIEKDGYTHS